MRTKYTTPLLAALLFFSSCATETLNTRRMADDLKTRSLMTVEVSENSGQGSDKIETIRFIVFSDLDSSPKLDINDFYGEDSFDTGSFAGEASASKVKITLEVPRKSSGSNEKLVVAIVNEPTWLNLGSITTPAQLEALRLDYFETGSEILNIDYGSLKTDVMMPMTGATWVSRYYQTEEEAELDANIVKLGVSRVLARVDVYLLNGGSSEAISIAPGSTAKLSNTYPESWFIRNEEGSRILGNIQTVTSDFEVATWTGATALSIPAPDTDPSTDDAVFLCSFYTPERMCTADGNADKLKLDLSAIITGEGTKSGSLVLDEATGTSGTAPINVIRRNNIYRVTATIGVTGITGIVQNWNSEEITQQF